MESNTSPAPLHQVAGMLRWVRMKPTYGACFLAGYSGKVGIAIISTGMRGFEARFICGIGTTCVAGTESKLQDFCEERFADWLRDAGLQPNPIVQPAATEPAEQAGRGPLGCDELLGADHLPEGKP